MSTLPRILAAALALTVASAVLPSPANGATAFDDVQADRWYAEPIAWLVHENITTGTEPGCFSPYDAVTRGQIVTFLYRLDDARGNAPQPLGHPFDDVTAAYQQGPVGWAYSDRVTVGTSATTFTPNAEVTRGDFATLLWRYAGTPVPTAPHLFDDVHRAYQQDAVAWMAEEGITTGTSPTTFHPEATMTRAQAATFLFRFMDAPVVAAPARSAETSCLAPLRDALEAGGLTAAEAACAAPRLVDVGHERVQRILGGSEPFSFDLFAPMADISASCIPTDRRATVIQLFF